ncbi:hypothetical protein HMPREF1146_2523 [Prevotella sp. MSX73]|nr:hypothetical protein HMPREF1146_2523 [Prevotella sp. MSX73]
MKIQNEPHSFLFSECKAPYTNLTQRGVGAIINNRQFITTKHLSPTTYFKKSTLFTPHLHLGHIFIIFAPAKEGRTPFLFLFHRSKGL